MHTTHSLAQNSFEVLENPPTLETLAIYPKLMGKIADLWKFERGKTGKKKPLVEFDSTNNSAHQSGLLVSNLEKINSREESKRRCMTERVLGSVDSTTRILSMDFDAADKSAHLVRPYQSGPVVSLLGNENKGEASKRECITKRILGLEDLQQNSGGRRDNAAKSFVEEKSQDLPRLMQIDGVEQRVTKSPRYLEGFTAQKWATRKGHSLGEKRPYEVSSLPMDLPRSLKLDCSGGLGARSTVGLPDGGYVLAVLEKKIVGKTLKRKCKTISLFSLEDDQQHGVKRWGDAAKSLGTKRIHRQHVFHWWLFQQSATGSPYGGHIQSLLMKEIVRETLKRKCRTSKWKDDVKNLGAKRIGRQLAIHRVSSRKHIIRPLAIHRSPFQQNWATLKVHCLGDERPVDHSQNERSRDQPEGCEWEIKNSTIEDLRPLVVFKRDYSVNQPEGRRIFSIDLEDLRQFISLRSADAVKELEALRMGRQLVIHCVSSLRHFIRTTMLICRPLVIHPLSSLELIIRPHAIHRLPFQQDPTLMEWYFSFKDERHFAAICLSMEGKLVSRLQLIHIRFGRCLPRPPLALLSSQLPFTSNITQLGGQDRSGSTASPSHNERTRDRPEGSKGKIRNLTIENLRSLGHLKRAEAAEVLGVSPATFKRHCRYLGIKEWPILPPKEVIVPPDQNGEQNPSPMFITLSNNGQITTENEMGGQNLVLNEHLQDSLEGPIFQNIGSGSIAEVENQNTIHESHHGHALSQAMPTTPMTTESSEFWRNALASVERHLMGSQSVPTNPHMTPLLTERQDSTLVKLNATYGEDTIKLRLPLTSGITELKQVVSTQLELGLDSFKVKYKDEHGSGY
ncbi:hypothetical protein Vadar_000038 [Vaccinium darrowii]|uniref:Uncharacterized protein n=1 Tax=Vaccinium darrowii TaxID=229202 RepID=A0ACB7YBS0_9ERIC|nr:hypothetical protein Vadar_000038 [Vaccinium darrowii]